MMRRLPATSMDDDQERGGGHAVDDRRQDQPLNRVDGGQGQRGAAEGAGRQQNVEQRGLADRLPRQAASWFSDLGR
jgi:hypothetical protein